MKQILSCQIHNQATIQTILSTHNTQNTTCPFCNGHVKTRPYDEYDMLRESYNISHHNLYLIDQFITNEGRKYASLSQTLKRIVSILNLEPQVSNGYTPLTILCHECHSVFRFHRTENSSHNAPCYCVFCGSVSISLTTDNDLDYLEVLSHAYKVPVNVIKVLLEMFQHQNHYQHFSDYFNTVRNQIMELK